MEKKLDAKEARVQIWEELLRVAKPDSKFSWQFSEFICDYEGSEKGTALLTATDMYKNARVIFITPDNNLETLREQAFRDKKTVVMTNYGITRGFFLIRPGQIPEGKEEIASLLDGVSRYWKHQTLAQLKEAVGHIDMMVTGASAMTLTFSTEPGAQANAAAKVCPGPALERILRFPQMSSCMTRTLPDRTRPIDSAVSPARSTKASFGKLFFSALRQESMASSSASEIPENSGQERSIE